MHVKFIGHALHALLTKVTAELPQPTRTLKRGSEGRIGHFKFDLRAPAATQK